MENKKFISARRFYQAQDVLVELTHHYLKDIQIPLRPWINYPIKPFVNWRKLGPCPAKDIFEFADMLDELEGEEEAANQLRFAARLAQSFIYNGYYIDYDNE